MTLHEIQRPETPGAETQRPTTAGCDIPNREILGYGPSGLETSGHGAATPETPDQPALARRVHMRVRKRNGDTEPVDVNKIVRAVERWADDLTDVDPLRVATKTISGLYDGATTAELDRLSIQTAAELIAEEPQYSKLAARLLAAYIEKEVHNQGIASFSQSIALGHAEG